MYPSSYARKTTQSWRCIDQLECRMADFPQSFDQPHQCRYGKPRGEMVEEVMPLMLARAARVWPSILKFGFQRAACTVKHPSKKSYLTLEQGWSTQLLSTSKTFREKQTFRHVMQPCRMCWKSRVPWMCITNADALRNLAGLSGCECELGLPECMNRTWEEKKYELRREPHAALVKVLHSLILQDDSNMMTRLVVLICKLFKVKG